MEKEKVIVTGGAGFIGSHIADFLVSQGYDVHIVDSLCSGVRENVNNMATLHVVDIRDRDRLVDVFSGARYVFHEAAIPQVQYSIENPVETNDVNVSGLLNILEISRLSGVHRVIFASSSAVYGNQEVLPITETMEVSPLSPYGSQKHIGEIYCRLYSEIYKIETVCLRYFNVFGPRQSAKGSYSSVIPSFIKLKKNNKPLQIIGSGENSRDYINVHDVVSANFKAMISPKVGMGETINIGSGVSCSVNDLAKLIGGNVIYLPPRVEPKESLSDISVAKKLLEWEPKIKLEEGIKELFNS